MKLNFILRLCLLNMLSVLVFMSCDVKNDSIKEGPMTDDTTGIHRSEAELEKEENKALLIELALINMHEIKTGDIASQKSDDQDVKDFGQALMDDHRNANRKLQPVARKMGVELPRQLDEKHNKKAQELQEVPKEEFRSKFLERIIKNHEKAIDKLKDAQDDKIDADLKSYIDETIPLLKQHLETAKKLQNSK